MKDLVMTLPAIVFTVRSWTMKQFGFTKDRFDKQFEIDDSFDYPE